MIRSLFDLLRVVEAKSDMHQLLGLLEKRKTEYESFELTRERGDPTLITK